MLTGFARKFVALSLRHAGVRAGSRIGLTSLLLLAGAGSVHDAAALNETRTLSFHHTHSGEDLTVTFKRNGRYDETALKQLNHYLRDWRNQDETVMDRHLFDIIWEVYRDVDGKQPIQIISAYRSPSTNAMLRRRSSGVARHSQHMEGHAMDLFIPGVPLEQIRFAGLRLQRGGVGFYPTSGSPFVHLDTGSIRHWPRMTHDQLVRVFPDGRTVHIPTDGVPLKGFELARADIEKRGNGDDAGSFGKPNFLAALFKGKFGSSSDDEDESVPAASQPPAMPARSADKSSADKAADPVPMPRSKPQFAAALQLASADAQAARPKAAPAAEQTAEAKPQTPADIINARGFWDTPATPRQATPAQVAALKAREALASAADPQPTASVFQAMAYAPAAAAPVDHAHLVTASAPIPRAARPASAARTLAQATGIDTVVAKGSQGSGQQGAIATSTRLSAAKGESLWLKILMLSPSVSHSMSVTMMGDVDMAAMRAYFVKPQAVITMSFTDDPMQGMSCDSFSGAAATKLETTFFTLRTAALR